jgi:transcriptional regulator with XRE-family HTH domain
VADSLHGPVVVRRRLGAKLKALRGEKGFGLDAVAKTLEFSAAKLSRLETGQVEPKLRDVRDLLDMYNVPDDLRQRLMHWAEDAKEQGWWQPLPPSARVPVDLDLYISLEAEAASVRQYSAAVAPGLLQIESYARTVISDTAPQKTPELVDELVNIRLKRQAALAPERPRETRLGLHAILDEAVLHRGPAEVLQDQLRGLLIRSELPNVTLQIFPFAAGWVDGHGIFTIFDPREEGDWPVVNVESTGRDHFYDSADDIAMFNAIWKDLTTRSLTVEQSRERIESLL